ncbi:MAG TPA: capsule assembly Wzi family protein [Longimicrobium sp.]|jgi:hypothetical protein|uniref:capsule assembly Wzi family protein n=1 Tax=Longimicrobium sp. TaxID=2029185 RepID=UPI002ED7B05C
MPRTLRTAALAAALLACARAEAQAPGAGSSPARDSVPTAPAAFRPLVLLGSVAEDRARTAALRGGPAPGLLRSASTATPRAPGASLRLLAPWMEAGWNKEIPHSLNDGALYAGRGGSGRLSAGVEAAAGPLRLVLAPEVVWEQNAQFDSVLPDAWDAGQRARFTTPWYIGAHSADLPYRFGDGARTRVLPGESSLTLRLGAVEAGAATEAEWWGPGIRNALVLSNNAGGFPHALLRTSRPLRTPLGGLEARWIEGRLRSSAWDTASAGRRRSLSAASLVLHPAANLSLGVARAVYAPADGGAADGAFGVFSRWAGAGDTARAHPFDQVSTLFGRWILPGDGAEVYGEWGRHRLPSSPREMLETPEHTQGYTLGFQWARPALRGVIRLQGELSDLEKSATYRAEPTGSWYAGRAVPQGYTHEGQPLGASIGPGASSQWLAVDYMPRTAQFGVFANRIRWANDAYYDKPGGHNRYRAHDVNILGGARAGVAAGPFWAQAEWTAGRRYNYLFQNPAGDWPLRHLSTSPFNHSLRLQLSARP